MPCISYTAKEKCFFFKDVAAWNRLKVPQEVIQEPHQDTGLRAKRVTQKYLASKAEFESPVPMWKARQGAGHYNPIWGGRHRKIPGAWWTDSLIKLVRSNFSDGPYLKKWGGAGKMAQPVKVTAISPGDVSLPLTCTLRPLHSPLPHTQADITHTCRHHTHT